MVHRCTELQLLSWLPARLQSLLADAVWLWFIVKIAWTRNYDFLFTERIDGEQPQCGLFIFCVGIIRFILLNAIDRVHTLYLVPYLFLSPSFAPLSPLFASVAPSATLRFGLSASPSPIRPPVRLLLCAVPHRSHLCYIEMIVSWYINPFFRKY